MAQTRSRTEAGPRGRPRDASADHRILAATFRQLVAFGYAGLSVEAVAAEAGVAKTTIYRRYPTRRDLAIAALSQEVPFEPPATEFHGREAVERFVRQAVTVIIESGAIRILGSLIVEEQRDPGLLAAFRARILEPRRTLIVELLQRGIERGEIRPDIDPLVVTEMIAGAVLGHHLVLGQPTTDDWVESLVDHVWAAIRA
jgi:AcrR family transcriptional regulator